MAAEKAPSARQLAHYPKLLRRFFMVVFRVLTTFAADKPKQ
jgi:hypothetical protein